jgi:hypothetical protein
VRLSEVIELLACLGYGPDLKFSDINEPRVSSVLNDAGALKQSDVGVAVVENLSAFSPASVS